MKKQKETQRINNRHHFCILSVYKLVNHMKSISLSVVFVLSVIFDLTGQTVLFYDDFKNNANNWQEIKTATKDVRIIPGREMYQIKHNSKITTEVCTAWTDVDLDENKDFRISALLYKEGGVTNYGYGLLWGGTTDNYYSFLVSPGGYYCVGKVVNGIWQDITPDGWIECGAVEQGRKGNNKLVITKKGDMYNFAINNNDIARMKCGPFFGKKIGFNINNKQKIMVDWIKVEYL